MFSKDQKKIDKWPIANNNINKLIMEISESAL